MIARVFLLILSMVSPVGATNYFIDPQGNNANNGTSDATPWKTFAYAINPARASCGDHLILAPGEYSVASGTGLLNIGTTTPGSGLICTLGNELTIEAQDPRKAKILDPTGLTTPIHIQYSAYINIDGLYLRNANNSSQTSNLGMWARFFQSNHINFINSSAYQVNKYPNTPGISIFQSQDIVVQDFEGYEFHRHCITAWQSARIRVTRAYCNPLGGKIPGGYSDGGQPLGSGDAVLSMYPCDTCIVENSIADGGNSTGMFMSEHNASFGGSVIQRDSKVLGTICYKCNAGSGVIPNSRPGSADLNHSPQNILIEDFAHIDSSSRQPVVKCQDCATSNGGVNIINRVTSFNIPNNTTDNDQQGITFNDSSLGVAAALNAGTVTNSIVSGVSGTAFKRSGTYPLVTGNELIAPAGTNGTNFSPSGGGVFTNQSTVAAGYGTCKGLWVPDGAPGKGAGTNGGDIGANILYRIVNGAQTTTPLWDVDTGEFPHGAEDADGINRIAGQSLFDIHLRLNVGPSGTCPFPAGYTESGGGGGDPSTVILGTTAVSGSGTNSLSWAMTVAPNQNELLVCVAMRDDASNVGSVTSVTSGGESLSLVPGGRSVTSPGWRAVEVWHKTNPTAGSRTILVSTTGAISGMVGRSMEFDASDGLNTAVITASPPNTPTSAVSVTAPTNTNELVVDCVASSPSVTFIAGSDQTALTNVSHATKSILLGTTTQNGSDGGVMSDSTGGAVYLSQVAVSIKASPNDPPTTATIELDTFRIRQLYGTEAAATYLAANNTQVEVGVQGAARIRTRFTAHTATTDPFSVALYCRKNADPLSRVLNTFNGNVFRLYGPDIHPSIPISLTATTDQLCSSNCVEGAFIRDDRNAFTVPSLASGEHLEMEWAVVLNASVGNTVTCVPKKDDGTALDTVSVTPTLVVVPNAAAVGF